MSNAEVATLALSTPHGPMVQQADLVLLKEPSGLLGTEGADSSDGAFEARRAQG